ncbi:MAG: biotin/lipoyl-binding protein, partial [Chloroflexi bacterium]|nr:biotin/lipoyl-binding protein [Chloroflexota bacterium]
MKYAVTVSSETPREVEVWETEDGLFAQLGDQHNHLDMVSIDGGGFYSLLIDEHSYQVFIEERDEGYAVVIHGRLYEVTVENEQARRARGLRGRSASSGRALVKSPMPGLVVDITVREGDVVAAGQRLVTLEAMKMENEIVA